MELRHLRYFTAVANSVNYVLKTPGARIAHRADTPSAAAFAFFLREPNNEAVACWPAGKLRPAVALIWAET